MDTNLQTAGNTTVVKPLSMSAGLTLTLLNADLAAILKRDNSITKILVMPVDAESRGMTVSELVEQIGEMIEGVSGAKISLKADEINGLLSGFGLNIDNLTITLRQAFLYWVSNTTLEYAFAIDVTSGDTLKMPSDVPEVFKIKSLSFAVWNTARTNILERMGIGDIDAMLV